VGVNVKLPCVLLVVDPSGTPSMLVSNWTGRLATPSSFMRTPVTVGSVVIRSVVLVPVSLSKWRLETIGGMPEGTCRSSSRSISGRQTRMGVCRVVRDPKIRRRSCPKEAGRARRERRITLLLVAASGEPGYWEPASKLRWGGPGPRLRQGNPRRMRPGHPRHGKRVGDFDSWWFLRTWHRTSRGLITDPGLSTYRE